MKKFKIKRGDIVQVISGDDKGRRGEVTKVIKKKDKVIIEGINVHKRHTKPSADNTQGGIVDKSLPIHISNVALIDKKFDKPTRVKYDIREDKKVRISKLSNEPI